jgi:hypothetical protein
MPMARRPYRPRRLRLAIKEQMAVRGIASVVALHALLREIGVDISHSQLTRIVNNESELLNLSVMNGLMTVLRCDATELFVTEFA